MLRQPLHNGVGRRAKLLPCHLIKNRHLAASNFSSPRSWQPRVCASSVGVDGRSCKVVKRLRRTAVFTA